MCLYIVVNKLSLFNCLKYNYKLPMEFDNYLDNEYLISYLYK